MVDRVLSPLDRPLPVRELRNLGPRWSGGVEDFRLLLGMDKLVEAPPEDEAELSAFHEKPEFEEPEVTGQRLAVCTQGTQYFELGDEHEDAGRAQAHGDTITTTTNDSADQNYGDDQRRLLTTPDDREDGRDDHDDDDDDDDGDNG